MLSTNKMQSDATTWTTVTMKLLHPKVCSVPAATTTTETRSLLRQLVWCYSEGCRFPPLSLSPLTRPSITVGVAPGAVCYCGHMNAIAGVTQHNHKKEGSTKTKPPLFSIFMLISFFLLSCEEL